MASSTSADSSIPDAAALARTCSGRDAPVIAEASSLRRRTQASASSTMVSPAPSAIAASFSTASSVPSRITRCIALFIDSLAARESDGCGCPGLYFPVSTP